MSAERAPISFACRPRADGSIPGQRYPLATRRAAVAAVRSLNLPARHPARAAAVAKVAQQHGLPLDYLKMLLTGRNL